MLTLIKDLNQFYKSEPALYQFSSSERGFEWVDYSDSENSVMIFMRKGEQRTDALIVVCNFTPEARQLYRVGVPLRGTWTEIFNSDNAKYGGSGVLNQGLLHTAPVKFHNKDYSVSISLPPLGISVLKLKEEMAEFSIDINT